MMNDVAEVPTGVEQKFPTLAETVRRVVENYLRELGDTAPVNLQELVIDAIERPLLTTVMAYTNNNQVKTAKILGIARGTLRARLKKYGMID